MGSRFRGKSFPAMPGTTVFPYGGPIFDGKNYSGQQCAQAGAQVRVRKPISKRRYGGVE